MSKIDRLTTLIDRFQMNIRVTSVEDANLIVVGQNAQPDRIILHPQKNGQLQIESQVFFAADVAWGGADNPLLTALPDQVELPISDAPDLQALVTVLIAEADLPRCGGASVLSRLIEVLMVRLLRHQIERGGTQVGLLAGLADTRLSRAIVAMHDRPGHNWIIDDLAGQAGLSVSRFAELFSQKVGQSPMSYLRQWRLTVARQDLQKGDRVERVARRFGYTSPEAFSRAYRKAYDASPISERKQGDAA